MTKSVIIRSIWMLISQKMSSWTANNRGIQDFSYIIYKLCLKNIQRIWIQRENIHSFQIHMECLHKIEHVLGHKKKISTNPKKWYHMLDIWTSLLKEYWNFGTLHIKAVSPNSLCRTFFLIFQGFHLLKEAFSD